MSGEREQANARLFDAVAATYDEVGFLAQAARFVAEVAAVQPHEAVLDVMTGTGTVLRALPHGGSGARVGTDLSAGMLAVARAELPGATFVQADAARLPFPDAQFDAVICAAGLFFMPDMAHTVREWARVLRPGGRLVVSSFGAGLLGDLPGLWRAALGAHGLKPGSPPWAACPRRRPWPTCCARAACRPAPRCTPLLHAPQPAGPAGGYPGRLGRRAPGRAAGGPARPVAGRAPRRAGAAVCGRAPQCAPAGHRGYGPASSGGRNAPWLDRVM
ncbi:class I SAM-dependent methyltransferase [Deinococcus multiflagellatus]|uniref:Methyltransferase domain-containing protein n=1 Tax=Deinococcus multiflagellatus TaxID=1656887 RepID=A0ABW1ZKB4_9DEIO